MSLTVANAVIMLGVTDLFDTPLPLQQFSADDVFSTGQLRSAETAMGVDGYFTAGFVFVPIEQEFTLQGDSLSNDIFDQWWNQNQNNLDVFFANATIVLPSLKKEWTMTKGVLTGYQPLPDAKKVAQPRKYQITWGGVRVAPTP